MKQYDLVIIGSGPAGLSAAIYASRAMLDFIVIEKTGMSGGQILNTYEVDNYPGLPGINGFDLGIKFREHCDKFNIDFVTEEVIEIKNTLPYKTVITSANTYSTKNIILAMGTNNAKLNVPGEDNLLGRGVSYCATCDGAFFRDQVVAVVGGSDVACEDAIYLARFCKKVYLIHRRDELRAAVILQNKVKSTSNIDILWDTKIEAINGNEVVETLALINKSGIQNTLLVNGVFIAIGSIPNTSWIKEIELNNKGYVIANEDCKTNIEGIYACGDIRTKQLRQVVTAVSDGANAITSVQEGL